MYERLRKVKIVDGILMAGILLIIIGLGMNFLEKQKGKDIKVELIKAKENNNKETIINAAIKKEIMADIEGEVMNPGVYKLNSGDRINDILVMAGGLGAKADRDWVEKNLNKSEILKDGQKIFIPKKGDVLGNIQIVGSKSQNSNTGGIIDLNTANIEELDKLSGVGPSIAQKIIDYREKNGGFKNVEEIKLVSGIGDKLFEKIKDQIGI